MKEHCISYLTKSLIFGKSLLFFQKKARIVDSYKFICVYFVSFYTNITKIETRSYHCRFNQNPTKKVMLLYKKIVLIRCCKWISFQSAEYNHY